MALWFPLKVNDKVIGQLSATRIDGESNSDSICTYRVEATDNTGLEIFRGQVRHRYGDGAWVLIRKALDIFLVYVKEQERVSSS